ncbi:hypothetical protein [uncultured Chitinophaga sp.]|uniref:hypothetical protein n=1 Tax=uncultured Chitinophaga sp. TaxID=339340 RepID=UPI0025D6464A|nr:hypothetical protein [uncultured Chitinophaga sp.]
MPWPATLLGTTFSKAQYPEAINIAVSEQQFSTRLRYQKIFYTQQSSNTAWGLSVQTTGFALLADSTISAVTYFFAYSEASLQKLKSALGQPSVSSVYNPVSDSEIYAYKRGRYNLLLCHMEDLADKILVTFTSSAADSSYLKMD